MAHTPDPAAAMARLELQFSRLMSDCDRLEARIGALRRADRYIAATVRKLKQVVDERRVGGRIH